MSNNYNLPKTRQEKIALLKGLQAGTLSLSDIKDETTAYFTMDLGNGNIKEFERVIDKRVTRSFDLTLDL